MNTSSNSSSLPAREERIIETSDFTVIIADSPELLVSAYQLRYEVFSKEMGDDRYSDHSRREWKDEDDVSESTIFVALDVNRAVIGTIRLTPLRLREFIGSHIYDFGCLAKILSIEEGALREKLARADRGLVSAKWRGKKVFESLQSTLESQAVKLGCEVLVGAVDTSNRHAANANRHLGWTDYPVVAEYRGFAAQAIYKILE
jgi:GNAT superfamily N-acetyltransferase